ncbi:ROK family transcriptional regulator [Sphingomonas sp. BAUL-RG-20F-R05-02]|uniref:ROK family transcriptional regulator n=1 Tax=Sphingomonas sp. BAUL-RG-20F-R05-02 TaxID=2914830 RepID=UPI001F58D4D4|nr:ROK family transcriptional regulator [Sphingomonas sp. BAUL-RG-20F-R05-02]
MKARPQPADGDRRSVPSADARDGRLSRSLSGTNLARAGDYNLRTVLQAIRLAPGTTRVAIAHQTGLTAATIANITGRLIEMGLVRVMGRRQGGRGQPPLELMVEPDGAFGIGVNIDRDHLTIVTMDLAGEVRSRTTREVAFALPDTVRGFLRDEMDRAIASGNIKRDQILGIGVAIPDDLGRISLPGQPEAYRAWDGTEVADLFHGLPWQVHCDNDAAAAALGEAEFGTGFDNPTFLYLLVSAGLGGGLVVDRSYHRGAGNRSGEIGLIPDASAGAAGATVQDTVSLSALLRRLEAAGLPVETVAALDRLEGRAAKIVDHWLDDAVRALTAPIVSVNCLIDPDAILIGGRLPMSLIHRLAEQLNAAMENLPVPSRAPIRPAIMAQDAPAIGAAILPFLDHLLPSDAILIQAGR